MFSGICGEKVELTSAVDVAGASSDGTSTGISQMPAPGSSGVLARLIRRHCNRGGGETPFRQTVNNSVALT